MDEPYEIEKDGTVRCRLCQNEAQVKAEKVKDFCRDHMHITVRCPNPSCTNFTGRGESNLLIGTAAGGDVVSCPECGVNMDPDAAQDEVWWCPKCGEAFGLDDDWCLERLPGPEDIGDAQYHAWADRQAEEQTEKEASHD